MSAGIGKKKRHPIVAVRNVIEWTTFGEVFACPLERREKRKGKNYEEKNSYLILNDSKEISPAAWDYGVC